MRLRALLPTLVSQLLIDSSSHVPHRAGLPFSAVLSVLIDVVQYLCCIFEKTAHDPSTDVSLRHFRKSNDSSASVGCPKNPLQCARSTNSLHLSLIHSRHPNKHALVCVYVVCALHQAWFCYCIPGYTRKTSCSRFTVAVIIVLASARFAHNYAGSLRQRICLHSMINHSRDLCLLHGSGVCARTNQ